MKRIVAILLCLLFPLTALADAQVVTFFWQAEQSGVQAWLTENGLDEASAQSIAAPAADLMNTLSFRFSELEDQQAVFGMLLQNEAVLTISMVQADSDTLLLQSNLLPSLTLAMDPLIADVIDLDLLDTLITKADSWFDQLECTTETGIFTGDAYTGGTTRYTWRITDAQLLALVRTFAEVLHHDLSSVESLLSCLEAENSGALQISVVTDSSDLLIGISVTLLGNDDTLATVSIHPDSDGLDIVLGYRLNGMLQYHALQVSITEDGLEGTMDSYRTTAAADFAALKAAGSPYRHLTGTMTGSELHLVSTLASGNTTAFDADLTESGLTTQVTSGEARIPGWSFHAEVTEAETLEPLVTEGTTVIHWSGTDLTNEEITLLQSALQTGVTDL